MRKLLTLLSAMLCGFVIAGIDQAAAASVTSIELYNFRCNPPSVYIRITGAFNNVDQLGLDWFGIRIVDGINNKVLDMPVGVTPGSTEFAPPFDYRLGTGYRGTVVPTTNPLRVEVFEMTSQTGPFLNLLGQATFTFDVPCLVTNQPPECGNASANPEILWPPNHKMVDISILGVIDPDADPVTLAVESIQQDEPTNGLGDGDMSPDGYGIGSPVASVRAERAGNGNGRVYHIGFSADDGNGGTCAGTVTVGVPKSQGSKGSPVDDGATYNSTQP